MLSAKIDEVMYIVDMKSGEEIQTERGKKTQNKNKNKN